MSKAYIKDYEALLDLRTSMSYCGESLSKFIDEVDSYLDLCMDGFQRQKEVLERLVQEAAERLREAQSDLSDCEHSQEYDEEEKEWRPSCSSERSHVNSAQSRYDKLKDQLDRANNIISNYEYELRQYREPRGILAPGGARAQLEYLANTHTKEGVEKMDKIIEIVVVKYLGRQIEMPTEMPEATTKEDAYRLGIERLNQMTEEVDSSKIRKFEEASERIREKQKQESRDLAQPNVMMVCPYCHRPLRICICARIRER